jgi:vacuolar-type H+-ATPase subunit F/Vma7
MFSNEKLAKTCKNFYCKNCDYTTERKSSYELHLATAKHQKSMVVNPKLAKTCNQYICQICQKIYKDNSGLWRHKNKNTCNKPLDSIEEKNAIEKEEIMHYLMNESKELKNLILEVIKNGTSNIHNITNTTNTNCHNKTFNLQVFLNETCKDAMNMTTFIDSLQLQLSDLENVGEVGFVEGISSIILKNLNALDVTQRPVHCTDKKRETMYIKDEDKWEKEDENKSKMHKMIKKVANKNIKLITLFQEVHPEWKKITSKVSDQFNKIVIEAMGGSGDNDYEKEEKIIKRVAKEVCIDKIPAL